MEQADRVPVRRRLSRKKLRQISEAGGYDRRPVYLAANRERDRATMEAWRHLRGAVNDEVLGDDEYWG